MLRSGFALGEFSEPLQLVYEDVTPPLALADLTALDEAGQDAAISAAIAQELATAFAFAKPPLFRILVHRRGPLEFQATIAEFHAILDGLSLHLMITELFARYASGLGRTAACEVTAPDLTFASFIAMERHAAAAAESRDFWSKTLAGAKPFLLGRTPSDDRGDKAMQRLTCQVPAATYAALQVHSKSYSLPLKHLFLAAHVQSLRSFSGQGDLVTGVVTNGRPELAGGDRVLGLFINTVPLRIGAPLPLQSWIDLARSAFAAETAMLPHRRVPLANIQRWAGAGPLFDVFFNFTQFEASGWRHVAEALGIRETRHIATDIDFGLAVDFEVDVDTGAAHIVFQYDSHNLSPDDMERLMGIYRRAVAALSEDPEQVASALAPPARDGTAAAATAEPFHAHDASPASAKSIEQVEARLRSIWADVLGRNHIDRNIRFDDLGGHSLLAVQALSRIRAETKVPLTLSEFLKNATLTELSGLISCKLDGGDHGRT
jgi:hypothetical protein